MHVFHARIALVIRFINDGNGRDAGEDVSGRLDLLVISESKIDVSFPDSMFHVEGFRLCRSDRKAVGGGLMVFVRSDVCFVRPVLAKFVQL